MANELFPNDETQKQTLEKLTDYEQVITDLFERLYTAGAGELPFTKDQLTESVRKVGVDTRNIPDITYTFRVRSPLPQAILSRGNWIIQGKGKGKYAFVRLKRNPLIEIPADLQIIPIPDSTPEIVLKYGGQDEQGLLSKIRYNRLIDIFLSLTAYQLQGHFRTTVLGIGQVEIDELYLGVDTDDTWYVIPIEAKSPDPRDRLGVVQVGSLTAFAQQHYPELKPRTVGAKTAPDGSIYLLEFTPTTDFEKIRTVRYKRYSLFHEEERRHGEK